VKVWPPRAQALNHSRKKKTDMSGPAPNSRNCGPRGSSARGQLFRPPEAAPAPMPAPSPGSGSSILMPEHRTGSRGGVQGLRFRSASLGRSAFHRPP
jgi:hypothetical protein